MSKPKTPNADQSSFLYPDLLDQLDPKHPLLRLARKIDWSIFEAEFSPVYGEFMFRLRWATDRARDNVISTGIGWDQCGG